MDERRYWRYFWILFGVTTLIRCYLAAVLGLGIDEAHYFQYAVHPALSYYDHPPLVGYLIRIFVLAFGKSCLTVRLPALLAGMLTMYLLFRLGRSLFSPAAGFWAVVFFNCIPLFSAIGGIMIVPDTILAVFWLLTAYLLGRIHQTGNRYFWYPVGLTAGLALITKYTGGLIFFSVLLFAGVVPEMRGWFRKQEPYLGFLLCLLIFLPVLVWNWQHHWVSFGFQLQHGFEHRAFFNLGVFLRNVGSQAGAFSPFIFLGLLFSLAKSVRDSLRRQAPAFLLLAFSLPVFLVFGLAGLSNEVLPHWPALGYLVLLPVLADALGRFQHHRGGGINAVGVKAVRFFLVLGLTVGCVMTLMVPLQALFKIFPIPADVDPTNDLVGWDSLGRRILQIRAQEPIKDFFVFTHKFYLAGELAFHLPEEVPVYCLSKRPDQYDFWQYNLNLKEQLRGRNGLFFVDEHFKILPAESYSFQSIGPEEVLDVYSRGKHSKRFYIYRCYGFDTDDTDSRIFQSLPQPCRDVGQMLQTWNEKTFLVVNQSAGKSRILDGFFVTVGWLGSGYVMVPIVAGLVWFRKRKRFWIYFGILALILILGGNLVHFLKEHFQAVRPALYFKPAGMVHTIGPELKSGSFPSGHSQTVFSGVFFLTWLWPGFWWVWWPLGILAGVSRCYVGAHFPLDVLAGILVAGVCFFLVRLFTWKIER